MRLRISRSLAVTPLALALLLLAVLTGCAWRGVGAPGAAASAEASGAGDEAPTTGHEGHGDGEMSMAGHQDHAAHGLPATAGPGYSIDDVNFMQMMIGHHDQALRMAALVEIGDAGPEVRTLARRIDIAQRDEIRVMERWLSERDQAVPDAEARLAMAMPGMVTPAQFERLERARGTDFDRLFLRYMIDHHLGAISMVDDLFASPGSAQDSELFQFVTDVGADQLDEIGIMERILDGLAPNIRSDTP
jgi:uncharacterized protein (DUF305 family)